MLERVAHDVRYAARFLRRSPGFALTVIAVLALGIGANTAVFSVARQVLLRPLPYPEPDRLVQYIGRTRIGPVVLASVPRYIAWREGIRAHEHIAAYYGGGPGVTLVAGDRREQIAAMYVSADYFHVFRAPVAFGRTFRPSEDHPHGPRLAVISHDFWVRHFGRQRNPVGLLLTLGDGAYEIVGVLGAAFRTEPAADIWLPLRAPAVSFDHTSYLTVVARLKRGVTVAMADDQARNTSPGFRRTFPQAMAFYEEFGAEPLERMVTGETRPALQMLSGAVVCLLLIACANAANLFVARASRRKTDIATRAALGAGRPRLLRQLFTECLMLALAGGALGFALGLGGVRALLAAIPGVLAPTIRVTADPQILLFTLSTSVLTAITFGLLPVVRASRVDLGSVLKDGSTGATAGGRHRLQSLLVVAEITLALVLLVSAGVLVRTFITLRTADPGFRREGLLTLQMPLSGPDLQSAASIDALVRDAERRLASSHGRYTVAATYALPLEPAVSLPFTLYNRPLLASPYHGVGHWRTVSTGYFDVFGIRLLRGRTFDEKDSGGAEPVVVINESMARRFWQNNNPVGEQLIIGRRGDPDVDERPRRITGVVADVRDLGLDRDREPMLYLPIAQTNDRMAARNNRFFPLTWVVRTDADGSAFRGDVQREVRAASGGAPIVRVRRIEEILRAATIQMEFAATLLSVFAAAALVLATVGLYGLVAYSLEQRRREIGIRLALGASPSALRNMVLAEGSRLTIAGLAIGGAGALATTRLLGSHIVGIAGWDTTVFVVVGFVLAAASMAATYSAQRAARTDPVEVLRI